MLAVPALDELSDEQLQTEQELAAADVAARRYQRRQDVLLKVASVLLLLLLWELLSRLIQFKAVVSPLATFASMGEEFQSGALLSNLAVTMQRVAESFALSMVIGTVLGIALGSSRVLDKLFGLWVTVIITIPGLILLIVGYIAFGIRTDAGAIFAVTTLITPSVLVSVIQGVRALDRRLQNMARSYGYNPRGRIVHVVLPQLAPYMFGAARYALPLSWHMVTFAEVVGRPNGFGFQIYYNYQTGHVEGVWAYSVCFIFVALLLEFGLMANLQRYFFRWRQEVRV